MIYPLPEGKRNFVFLGEAGCGKSELAVNLACRLAAAGESVHLFDLDMTKPLFRTRDLGNSLADMGIALHYEEQFMDAPTVSGGVMRLLRDEGACTVLDVGGDDRGALALGRLVPAILEEGNYEMLLVINRFRPLTRDAESVKEVVEEIQAACRLPFTGIVNNSNLGAETAAEDILGGLPFAEEVSRLCRLPIKMTTAEFSLMPALEGKIPDLFPLKLQKRPTE